MCERHDAGSTHTATCTASGRGDGQCLHPARGRDLGATAFGDEPVVIYKGERMRWRNADAVEHNVVTDAASLPEFMTTGPLTPGSERSFIMNTNGTTRIHCTIHPQMTGTLVVRER